MMQVRDYFKKGDTVYAVVAKPGKMVADAITECTIDKLTTDDRLKSYSEKAVNRAKSEFKTVGDSPKQLAWVTDKYGVNPFKEWVETDRLQREPTGHFNTIN